MSRLIPLAAALLAVAACSHAQPVEAPPVAAPQPPAAPPKAEHRPPAPAAAAAPSGEAELEQAIEAVRGISLFFAFDKAALPPEANEKLGKVAEVLQRYPKLSVRVEGNCDERGPADYNVALGQRRAEAARGALLRLGARAGQVSAVSYGSERPKVQGHDEAAWAQNRRDDVVVAR